MQRRKKAKQIAPPTLTTKLFEEAIRFALWYNITDNTKKMHDRMKVIAMMTA
jgi:hypothetical protein